MPIIQTTLKYCICILAVFILTPLTSAYAQSGKQPIDIIPASALLDKTVLSAGDTHPALKLTPDKSELIRLEKKAGSVIIGNPAHVSVLAENAKTLVLIPAMPGATQLTVLDTDSNVIMRRHIIIATPKERYVRVRKACRGGDEGCEPTRVYFCPDMCHEVSMTNNADNAANTDNNAVPTGPTPSDVPETPDDTAAE